MHTLENDIARLSVSDQGELVELQNKKTGTNYAGGQGLWRLIYQDGISLEEKLDPTGLTPQIRADDDEIRLTYDQSGDSRLAFVLEITIVRSADSFILSLRIDNRDSSRVIRECFFPLIGDCQIGSDHELYWTKFGGQRFGDIGGAIEGHHTNYIAQDNVEVQMSLLYPGPAAMNFFLLGSETQGLYVGSHDPTFQATNHFLGRTPNGAINVAIDKYPFLAPGQSTLISQAVVTPYTGSWHAAARRYRDWADTWFTPPAIPDSIRDMTSWHRVVMRHQYGKTFFRYDQLEDILSDGLPAGIKTLFMFGWHQAGHDAGYPDYRCDESQGGFEGLKRNIQRFQAGGGRVILYFNGRLIDAGSEFSREHGQEVCIKRPDGTPSNDFYPFGADGTALRLFGNKSFVTACPSSRRWQEILKRHVDTAHELGCDGVFFDQLGFMPAMCFDPEHGHKVPFTDIMAVNTANLQELRAYTKAKDPSMSFGIEWISDVTSQHVDFVHMILAGTGTTNDWTKGEKPRSDQFLELFYYAFPEVRITDRGIRDDTDIERRVNFALLKGLRSDVEIYRCRATIAEAPHYAQYLAKANALRERYADLLLNGRYCDTDHFEIDNDELFATSFSAGDRLAIVVSQSHLPSADATLQVPGYSYREHAGLGDFQVDASADGIRIQLSQHGLVVIVLQRG
jgi:uncharacterized protein DUF6259